MQKKNNNNPLAQELRRYKGIAQRWKSNFDAMRNSYITSRNKLSDLDLQLTMTKKALVVVRDDLDKVNDSKIELEKEIKFLKDKLEKVRNNKKKSINTIHAEYDKYIKSLRRDNTLMFSRLNGIQLTGTDNVDARKVYNNVAKEFNLLNSSSGGIKEDVVAAELLNSSLNMTDDKELKSGKTETEKKEEEEQQEDAKEKNDGNYTDDDSIEYIDDPEIDKTEKKELETAESIIMDESRSSDSESNEQDRDFIVLSDNDDEGDDDYNPEDDASDEVDCVMTQNN